jgi:trimeric autotransporter adhesin
MPGSRDTRTSNSHRQRWGWPGVLCLVAAVGLQLGGAAKAQLPDAPSPLAGRSVHGGVIHGTVMVETIPRGGVTVIVTNPVTGSRSTTITDAAGAYSVTIPQDGEFFVRAGLEGFSAAGGKAVLSAAVREQRVDFSFEKKTAAASQNLASTKNLAGLWPSPEFSPIASSGFGFNTNVQIQTSSSLSTASVPIPSFPGDLYFSNDSFIVNGQGATLIPYVVMAGLMENDFENGPELQDPSQYAGEVGNFFGNGPSGGGFSAVISTNLNQPHGLVYWTGGNSALDARPYVLVGQPAPNPSYSSNSYGMVLTGKPFLPGLTKPSNRDFVLLTYAGESLRSLVNQYGVVPTVRERNGDFSQLVGPTGEPVLIYPPNETNIPYPNNTIDTPFDPIAMAMLPYIPEPNVPGAVLNYHLLTTQGTHSNTLGFRYNHSFGNSGASIPGQFANSAHALNQSFSLNFNLNELATDVVNLFPQLGGKQSTEGYALTAGYTIGKGSLISNLAVTSNRSGFEVRNFYTNSQDIATQIGLQGPGAPVNSNSFNYGLPSLVFSGFSGFTQTQPASILTQTIAVSNTTAWVHGSHDVRFGGDARRIELNFFGGANATGTLIFTGAFTQAVGMSGGNQVAPSGSAFADLLVGYPQEVTIESPAQKAYTRQNDWQLFIRDDWRALPNLTFLAGLRYTYFSPYAEKNDRLSTLDYVPGSVDQIAPVQPYGIGPISGAKYPRTLIYPERNNFSPHLGFAWQASSNTTVRGGYGIHYTVGQYGSFIQYLAYQPPFATVLNEGNFFYEFNNKYIPFFSTANAFTGQAGAGNYAVNRNYRVPYVQVWTMDVEQELPSQMVLDASYIGAKGTRLDVVTAPGDLNQGPFQALFFDYEDSTAFSNFNGLNVTLTRRLQRGLALGATYTYSHAIDNASSINAGTPVVAQNWQNLLAEEGNSSFDIRHQVYGSFLYELPFGPNMSYWSSGSWISHLLGRWSIAGVFAVATGVPLTPNITASVAEVERGTHGSVRPNRNFGVPITAGGGHAAHWFNTAAFSTKFSPGQLYGTASRNSIPGPGLINISLSLSKMFLLGDSRSLEFRSTATNALNNVQYGTVNTSFDSPTVGQVTSTQPMRQLTFLGRFRF